MADDACPSAALFALDVLHLRGEGVPGRSRSCGPTPACSTLDVHGQLAPDSWALLRFGASVFPHTYDLSVEPAGSLGHTPRLWLSASLGLEWQLR